MPINVLVVDDSAFFRRRIKEILEKHPDLKVVGFADNGKYAIEKAKELKPDVITMDYEMPVMDGISAVKIIMQETPTPILMFSSLSFEGARVTLDALEAGALDYLPKSFESMSSDAQQSAKVLQEKVVTIERAGRHLKRRHLSQVQPSARATSSEEKPKSSTTTRANPISEPGASTKTSSRLVAKEPTKRGTSAVKTLKGETPRLLLIGASTGGPVAIQSVLASLPANFPCPILLVQHMPGTFTSAFAERLDRLCKIRVKEAEDNDQLKPGLALLAPGGMQMLVEGNGKSISIIEGNDKIQYRPSVDVTFGSVARSIKGKVLAVVLTGMGQDGREGCKLLKRNQATIWTQSEASCVVYGMPMAVATAGLSDAVVDIKDLGTYLNELT